MKCHCDTSFTHNAIYRHKQLLSQYELTELCVSQLLLIANYLQSKTKHFDTSVSYAISVVHQVIFHH